MPNNFNRRGKGMEPKIRSGQLLTDEELKKFIEADCKLLTSKQLANVLSVSDAALRKQRSNKRSILLIQKSEIEFITLQILLLKVT